jgi:hypothetical protein
MFRSRAAGALAAAAALSLVATPAMARGWGWRHHHHNDIDAGDVFGGLLIVGGIAAIASAVSKSNKDRQARDYDRDRDYADRDYVPPQRYSDERGHDDRDGRGGNWRSGLSVDGAVDACVGEVERGSRSIDSVDAVNRDGDGWRVQGRIRDGRDFTCSVDGEGRIRGVTGF